MNLKALLYLSFFSAFICSCQSDKKSSKYLRHIGDIEYDGTMDKPDFFLCNEKDIIQYHNNSNGLEYKDEECYYPKIDSNEFHGHYFFE